MTQLFIKNGNAHEKNVHLLEEINQLKNEKIQWAEQKCQMQLKIQKLELQLESCNSKSAQKSEPIKREPDVQKKRKESPELQLEKPGTSEIKQEFLSERKIATATRNAECLVCGTKFNRNASAKRHFKNAHADDCLSAFATPVEIFTFKNLEKKEPDQWLQRKGLKWDQWIRDDGSIFGRPKKTALKVATPKNTPEKENPTTSQVATQLPTATG